MTGLFDRVAPGDAPELRPYQVEQVERIEDSYRAGYERPLLVSATGSGKTVVGAEILRREVLKGSTALVLAPRRELIFQTSGSLDRIGLDHAVMMAGADDPHIGLVPITVASVGTTLARVVRQGRRPFPDPSLIIVDEAHLMVTKARKGLLDLFPRKRLLGLTATPSRMDGNALGILFDDLVEPITPAELTEQGYLVPAQYYSIAEPDLDGVKIVMGDYHQGQLDAVVNQATLVADIVETWLARAGGRRTAVYATSVAHAIHLAESFQRAGVPAEWVSADTPTREREAVFARFSAGETQVLCNCFLAAYGFDLPELSCIVLARPTKSLVLYLQMLGRGLRIAEGKTDCLVLDHSGAVLRHGFATDPRLWTLEGKRALVEPERRDKVRERKPIVCPECMAVYEGTRTCPECGYVIVPRGRQVETVEGELVEVGVGLPPEEVDRQVFFAELRGYCQERGWKPGAAAHKFKERFGVWPPWAWNQHPALVPSRATRNWLKSRQIAYAKAKRRERMVA